MPFSFEFFYQDLVYFKILLASEIRFKELQNSSKFSEAYQARHEDTVSSNLPKVVHENMILLCRFLPDVD
jgi:hypothetical protein